MENDGLNREKTFQIPSAVEEEELSVREGVEAGGGPWKARGGILDNRGDVMSGRGSGNIRSSRVLDLLKLFCK